VERYHPVSAGLHWLTATLVIALIALALFDQPLEKALGTSSIRLHKSLGMTVFGLTLLRILWRLRHRAPPLPESTGRMQRAAAWAVHLLLYGFLLGLPLLGYVLSSGGPYPMHWFGIAVAKLSVSKSVGDAAAALHVWGGYAMIALLAMHIAAALHHQFVVRDRLILRMLPAIR
jgi:cytochrome b561